MKKISLVCLLLVGIISLAACGSKDEEVTVTKKNTELNLKDMSPEVRGALAYQGILVHHQEDTEVLRTADLIGESSDNNEVIGRESEDDANEFQVKKDKLVVVTDEFGDADYELLGADLFNRFYKTSVQKLYTDRLANRIQNDESDSVLEQTVSSVLSLFAKENDSKLDRTDFSREIRVLDQTDSIKTIYDIYLADDDVYTLRMKGDTVKLVDEDNDVLLELTAQELLDEMDSSDVRDIIDNIEIMDEAPELESTDFEDVDNSEELLVDEQNEEVTVF